MPGVGRTGQARVVARAAGRRAGSSRRWPASRPGRPRGGSGPERPPGRSPNATGPQKSDVQMTSSSPADIDDPEPGRLLLPAVPAGRVVVRLKPGVGLPDPTDRALRVRQRRGEIDEDAVRAVDRDRLGRRRLEAGPRCHRRRQLLGRVDIAGRERRGGRLARVRGDLADRHEHDPPARAIRGVRAHVHEETVDVIAGVVVPPALRHVEADRGGPGGSVQGVPPGFDAIRACVAARRHLGAAERRCRGRGRSRRGHGRTRARGRADEALLVAVGEDRAPDDDRDDDRRRRESPSGTGRGVGQHGEQSPRTRVGTNLADPWKLGMDRVPDVGGQRRGAIEVVEVRLEPADEVVGSVHAVPTFLSRRASASMAARRCFRAKCSRDRTVPTGVPMASAASAADRPM